MTPERYLEQLVMSDRGPEHDEMWMTKKLQSKWPGNYKVVGKYERKPNDYGYHYRYWIEFDTPADETWFRLQYA